MSLDRRKLEGVSGAVDELTLLCAPGRWDGINVPQAIADWNSDHAPGFESGREPHVWWPKLEKHVELDAKAFMTEAQLKDPELQRLWNIYRIAHGEHGEVVRSLMGSAVSDGLESKSEDLEVRRALNDVAYAVFTLVERVRGSLLKGNKEIVHGLVCKRESHGNFLKNKK